MSNKWNPIPKEFRKTPCFKCGGLGCIKCHNEGTEYAHIFWTRKWMDRNDQTLRIRRGQIWLSRRSGSSARWEVTELHYSMLNVAEPDTIIEVVLVRADRDPGTESKLISPEGLLARYIPEDPLPDVKLKVSPDRKGYSGKNSCICCGKELKEGTHKWIMLDSAMCNVIDSRFAPDDNGGLHAISNECAKVFHYEEYLVK